MDLLLVLAVLALIVVWWRMATRPQPVTVADAPIATIAAPTPSADTAPIVNNSSNGQALPTMVPEQPIMPDPFVATHEVESGETLLAIANRYGVTVEDIQAANGLESVLIRAGDELVIPIPEAVAEESEQPALATVFSYTVQPGDTVVSIAIRFGTQIETILEANNLSTNDFIRPDQQLQIPVEQVPASVITSSDTARGLPASTTTYEAVRIIGPQNGEILNNASEILFRWISVDLLAPNEWYVLRVWPIEGTTEMPPTIWTKTTSHRMSTEWAPTGRTARFGWQVAVVRILPDDGTGREIETASTPGEVRTFNWQ